MPPTGRWRIVDMELWDQDAIDLLGPERAALEISDRDRVIRIAKREGATFRALAEATGLSRQTIANICAAGSAPARKRSRAS